MIRLFYGDDRMRAQAEVEKILGQDYEVFEGENLRADEMDSLFLGTTLFGDTRRILVKDLGENGDAWAVLPRYLATSHEVVIWEGKLDKRTAAYKELAKGGVEMREFRMAEAPEKKLVFDVLDAAMRGEGSRAIGMVERLETTNDPYMFVGLMVSQVMRKLENGDSRAVRVIKMLADCDEKLKSTGFDPWTLIKAFLVQVAAI